MSWQIKFSPKQMRTDSNIGLWGYCDVRGGGGGEVSIISKSTRFMLVHEEIILF